MHFTLNTTNNCMIICRLKERKTKALQKKNARQTAKAMGIHWQNRHLSDKWIDYCNQMGANNSGIRDKKQK